MKFDVSINCKKDVNRNCFELRFKKIEKFQISIFVIEILVTRPKF